jgi:hypothetical protein
MSSIYDKRKGVLYRMEGSWKDSCFMLAKKITCIVSFKSTGKRRRGEVIRVSEKFKIYGPDKFESSLASLDRKKEKPLLKGKERERRRGRKTFGYFIHLGSLRCFRVLTAS